MRPSGYWDKRCERWGAWRVGARGMKVATWARLRTSSSALASWPACEEAVPELHLEERETHELVLALAGSSHTRELAMLALAAYPRTARLSHTLGISRQVLAERLKRLHRMLARLLDQRRRGVPLNVERSASRGRTVTVRAQGVCNRRSRVIASVVVDDAGGIS